MINVGVLGCSWEGSGPGQPRAGIACVATRSSSKTSGMIP